MRLSPHFTLAEFATSASYPHLARPVPVEYQSAALLLATLALQPARDALKMPLRILSGYRSEELNLMVGGSETSQHRFGQAADVTCANPRALFEWLCRTKPAGIGQVIFYPEQRFVHVALLSPRYPVFSAFTMSASKTLVPVASES